VREESTGPKGLGLRSAAHHDERQALLTRSPKQRHNDYDGYIEIPNDLDIPSALGWWRDHYHQYPDMGRMVRGVLAVSASGCAVERQLNYYLASYLTTLDW
jgi:hAT family C-terminal dimerisation region